MYLLGRSLQENLMLVQHHFYQILQTAQSSIYVKMGNQFRGNAQADYNGII